MPTFPTYRGEMPAVLSPLNPRHYWLLLYWIVFRQTALNCYLYQANPRVYLALDPGIKNFQRTLHIIAYRHLYVMVLVISFILPFLFNGLIVLFLWAFQGVVVDWHQWFWGVILGIALAIVSGLLGGLIIGVSGDVPVAVPVIVPFWVTGQSH
jgi:hypothetical protein